MQTAAFEPALIRAQTEKILASPLFTGARRMSEFLRFVVEESLAGRGDRIKEYVIGVEVYRKAEGYDPRLDPTVRVEASKLRSRLEQFYGTDGLGDGIVISIPKGAYVPVFDAAAPEVRSVPTPVAPVPRPKRAWFAVGFLAASALPVAWLALRPSDNTPRTLHMAPITAYRGEEREPSFSPDGKMVAFSWNGETEDNFDVYAKMVHGSDPPLRLTTDPAPDRVPVWSPDGTQIAFIRNMGPRGAVYLIAPLGGSESRLTTTQGWNLAWTHDSRHLLIADRASEASPYSLFLVSVPGGERRKLTSPPPGILGDYDFAVSPDDRDMVFTRASAMLSDIDIYLGDLVSGNFQLVVQRHPWTYGLAWVGDRREILLSSKLPGGPTLCRLPLAPGRHRETGSVPVAGLEPNVVRPVVAPGPSGKPFQVAFQREQHNVNIWRTVVAPAGGELAPPLRIAPSSREDVAPQFSPDGRRIAFASDRTGNYEIWVCDQDGSRPTVLAPQPQVSAGSPRWSPDGRWIAFDGRSGANRDIYIVSSLGGSVRRLTTDPSGDARPSWSRDGRWIYFGSTRTGAPQIFRMPVEGGAAIQVTRQGGFEAFESTDRKFIYYTKTQYETGLWSVPVDGGQERRLLDSVHEGLWSSTGKGIYFVDSAAGMKHGFRQIRLFVPSSGRVGDVGLLRDLSSFPGFSVSPDGQAILATRMEQSGSDLILLTGLE